MSVQVGQKVWVPSYQMEVTVTKVENNVPSLGKFIDDKGNVQVVDLVIHTWELISIIKKIIGLIKSLFKK